MSKLPTAVMKADEEADKAIEQDSKTFDPNMIGVDDQGAIQSETIQPPQPNLQQMQSQAVRSTVNETGQSATESLIPESMRGSQQQRELTPQDKIETLTRELEHEKQRFSSLLGRVESQMKPQAEENRVLRKKVQELEQELATIRESGNIQGDVQSLRKKLPNDIPMDDHELEILMRTAREVAREELEKRMPAQTEQIRNEFSQETKRVAMGRFVESLEEQYPGFIQMDANKDPRWMAFLGSALPRSGGKMTFGMVAHSAIQDMDMRAMREIVDEFCNQSGVRFGGGNDPRVEAQARPKTSQASQPSQSRSGKPVFTTEQVARFNKDYASGIIYKHLSKEQVAELKKDIEEAEDEGRIVSP